MRPASETIRLGAREWSIRPLNLRQVQEIEPILIAGASEAKGNISAAMAIVAIALKRDNAEAASALGDVEATAPEIAAAMATVLRLGGFLPAAEGDCAPGEV
ncbi:hypothetical protein [Methylocella silvestris]|uniref:Uncharacterized protein n=1 Tax=Methylocella silvestris TaxID=199596 RepID=A0A2J7TFH3_METSI|nr:hypothetical protein [Methylocella silvestris]PNG25512.1 hypothetical protein CR492_13425 [Methylocella silvestris]